MNVYNLLLTTVKYSSPPTVVIAVAGLLVFDSTSMFIAGCVMSLVINCCAAAVWLMLFDVLKRSRALTNVIDVEVGYVGTDTKIEQAFYHVIAAIAAGGSIAATTVATQSGQQFVASQEFMMSVFELAIFILATWATTSLIQRTIMFADEVAETTPLTPRLPFSRRTYVVVCAMTLTTICGHIGVAT